MITLDHNKKSIAFLLISGYFVKCGIIMSFKLFTLDTLYTDFFLSGLLYIAPTPKKDWILYKIYASLIGFLIKVYFYRNNKTKPNEVEEKG